MKRDGGSMCVRLAKAVALVAMAAAGMGCAIHTQGPIREVAYDFSDYELYDRAYAPSPQYREVAIEHGHLAPLAAPAAAPAAFDGHGFVEIIRPE